MFKNYNWKWTIKFDDIYFITAVLTAAHCVYYKHENQHNKQLYSEIYASFNAHSQNDGDRYLIPVEDIYPHFDYCFIANKST